MKPGVEDMVADVSEAAELIAQTAMIYEPRPHPTQSAEKEVEHNHTENDDASAPDEEGLLPSYDCVILGTGLTESIVACALARAGTCVCVCVCVCV